MAVSSIVMIAVYAFFINGIRYYRTSNTNLELQRACLSALTQISNEIAEGSKLSFVTFREGEADVPGIIFGSPRNAAGNVEFSGQNIMWMKFVCYYRGEVNGVSTLMRKELPLIPPRDDAPVVPAGLTPESFSTDATLPARVVSRQVVYFDVNDSHPFVVKLAAEDQQAQFRVEVSTSLNLQN
ncbi:MAG: hypothetical protein HY319_17830 [Armatimonadetes bacterium]|nr:hypothetical protein [Armatimonadota bacterium]